MYSLLFCFSFNTFFLCIFSIFLYVFLLYLFVPFRNVLVSIFIAFHVLLHFLFAFFRHIFLLSLSLLSFIIFSPQIIDCINLSLFLQHYFISSFSQGLFSDFFRVPLLLSHSLSHIMCNQYHKQLFFKNVHFLHLDQHFSFYPQPRFQS